jgi:hypothetical protein
MDVKFNRWHNHVINFLTILLDKNTEAQLNVLYLHVDRIEIRKLIDELNKLKETNMPKIYEFDILPGYNANYFGLRGGHIDLLKMQKCKILTSLPAAEMINGKTIYVKDDGYIKKILVSKLSPGEAEIACRHGYHIDIWLSLIMTTMHIQLSFFQHHYSNTKKQNKKAFVLPAQKDLYFYFLRVFTSHKDNWQEINDAPNEEGISTFSGNKIKRIADICEEYQAFMNIEEKKLFNKDRVIRTTCNIKDNLRKLMRNQVLFKRDLQLTISNIMDEHVYPLCENDPILTNLFSTQFNAAMNNDVATLLMTQNDLLKRENDDKNHTHSEKKLAMHATLKSHMHYITEICKEWYKLPDFTFLSGDYRNKDVVDPKTGTTRLEPNRNTGYQFKDLECLYMSEETRGSIHHNIIS